MNINRKRRGISELIGAIMTVAITLVAGTIVFSFVRSQAGQSEVTYAQNVAGTMNYLAERFTIPLVSYTSNSVTIYIYNNGQTTSQFTQIEVYGPTRGALDVVFDANYATVNGPSSCKAQNPAALYESPMLGTSASSFSGKVNYVSSITLTLPPCTGMNFQSGNTYFVKLLGQYGNTAVYYQGM